MKLIECVPNFSEGRDMTVVTAIRDAIAAVEGVSVLHVTADASHNRSVITFVAPYETAADAAFAGIRAAQDRIDLTTHSGAHPRIGAADVVPFIPLDGATMEDCITLAHVLGERVGRELEIPVYLYERAATHPSRQQLADVRRGGFEGIRQEIGTHPTRAPDYGPARVHPTFGAVAIGARPFLVAFNAYLGGAEHLAIAKEVARAVRASNGGLPFVKALGLDVDGQAQVSMNLVDIEQMPLSTVFDAVRREARARGVDVTWSEIIGLVPERVLFETTTAYLRLRQPVEEHVLERRLRGPVPAWRYIDGTTSDISPSEVLVWSEFKTFLIKQNVLALAVAVIIGAALAKVVSALVADLIMPIVTFATPGGHWRTVTWSLGSIHFGVGDFAGAVVDFAIIGFITWRITKAFIKPAPTGASTKTCPFCRMTVDAAATKCAYCTSALTS